MLLYLPLYGYEVGFDPADRQKIETLAHFDIPAELQVNQFVDERRDYIKSTRAAIASYSNPYQ
ncbi:hypothetical protein [Sulfuricurvum sp.]|uniref:hypothetical protein n=1 Tax=Sulfuricurvum sp. TaxID=2025608 RepID=UPI0019A39AAA|nr:hypothetical protein [Sulfuricurvum sp.]MBD3805715.1 hypothetical protein [Sulfuricurvum sp.]